MTIASKADIATMNTARPAHDHHHPPLTGTRWERVKQATRQSFCKERFIQYAKGEFIGDFGAVPLTIGVQRYFPKVMNGIRRLTEPLMRPIFKYGIERSSKGWRKGTMSIPSRRNIGITYRPSTSMRWGIFRKRWCGRVSPSA